MYKSKKKFINKVVAESIDRLLDEAKSNSSSHPERSKRYLQLVWKFIQRYKFKLSREKRLLFCKKCFTYWDNKNVKIEKKGKITEYKCSNCNYIKRIVNP